MFTVVVTLLLSSIYPTGWRILSGVLMVSGGLLLLTAMSPKERVAIFPGILFFGTALLQQFFGIYSFHWYGDVIVGYSLLAGISALSYFLMEPVAPKYLVFGIGLSGGAGFAWCTKHYVWPWRVISEATWLAPLSIVIKGLAFCLHPREKNEQWKNFRILHNE